MDLIGLTFFSLALSLFGAFQSVPFTNIGPEVYFPERLLGSFRFGYVFGTIGELVEMVVPTEYSEDYPPPPGTPVEPPIPHLAALSMSLGLPPYGTAGLDDGIGGKWIDQSPMTDSPSVPIPTEIFVVVEENPATEPPAEMPESLGMEVVLVRQVVLVEPTETYTAQSKPFPGPPVIDVNSFALFIYGSVVLVLGSYFLFVMMVARTICRRSQAELARAADKANEEVERMNREVKAFMSEISGHKSRLQAKLEEIDNDLNKEIDNIIDTAVEKESRARARISHYEEMVEETCTRVAYERQLMADAVIPMLRQFLPLPSFKALLKEDLDPFRGLVTEATEEILTALTEAKGLVSNAKKEASQAVKAVKNDALGDVAEQFRAEKARLRTQLAVLRATRLTCPEIEPVRAEVVVFEEHMASLTRRMERLVAKAESSVSGLPALETKSDQIRVSQFPLTSSYQVLNN